MKILITTDFFAPAVNGVVTSVLSLVHGLEKRGHTVRILTLSATPHTHVDGNVIYLGSYNASRIYPGVRILKSCPAAILEELIRWQPNVVHSQCEWFTFRIARQIARRCGAPLIHTDHTVYEAYTHYVLPHVRVDQKLVAWLTRQILNRTDAVIAPTEKIRQLLSSDRVRTPVTVIPTGLEESALLPPPHPQDRAACRRRFGIPTDAKVLLYLGRLAKEKNIPFLFRLLCRPELRDVMLVLAGDGPYRPQLENMVRAQHLTARVRFLGMVPHTKVARFYQLSDLFVNASHSETQGLTYLEAMAARIPVVCLADPCVSGLIENGLTGYACNSERAMAQAIVLLLHNASLRARMVQAASERIAEAYTSDAFAAAVETLYLRIIAQKRMVYMATDSGRQ